MAVYDVLRVCQALVVSLLGAVGEDFGIEVEAHQEGFDGVFADTAIYGFLVREVGEHVFEVGHHLVIEGLAAFGLHGFHAVGGVVPCHYGASEYVEHVVV